VTVSRTPSGKWTIRGATDNADGKSTTFATFSPISDLDQAIRDASDWAGPRGITRIYVKGNPRPP
jgi:hypothetical protein